MKAKPRRFQAEIAGETIDLMIDADEATIDGRTVPFSCERLSEKHLSLLIGTASHNATILDEREGTCRVSVGNREFQVHLKNDRDLLLERFGLADAAGSGVREIHAPMPGLVLTVAVDAGHKVEAGDALLVLEAMKMENELRAERGGIVKIVHVAPGDAVRKNDLLLELE